MDSPMELLKHRETAQPRFGCVVHDLKFYPRLNGVRDAYNRQVALSGLLARQLVRYLNTYVEAGAYSFEGTFGSSRTSGVMYRGRRVIAVKQQSMFKLNMTVSITKTGINEHVEHFLKQHYPIRKSVWVEVN